MSGNRNHLRKLKMIVTCVSIATEALGSVGSTAGSSWPSSTPEPSPSPASTPTSADAADAEAEPPFTLGATEHTPYQCQFCDKAFPRLSYLKKHEQVFIMMLHCTLPLATHPQNGRYAR